MGKGPQTFWFSLKDKIQNEVKGRISRGPFFSSHNSINTESKSFETNKRYCNPWDNVGGFAVIRLKPNEERRETYWKINDINCGQNSEHEPC